MNSESRLSVLDQRGASPAVKHAVSTGISTARRIAVVSALLASSCALAHRQAAEANARAARMGHPEVRYAEELSPGLALALGFLPFGAGGLYVHRNKLAASGLLWPLSVLWVPKMAYETAIEVNDQAFEARMMAVLEREPKPE